MALEGLFGCPIYRWSGLMCPGCGLTRAWLCFLCGDWGQAVQYHLLFLPTPVFLFLFAHRETALVPQGRWLDVTLAGYALMLAVYHVWRTCFPGTQ
ncbi:MAG: DUF2752 domain-containing protein [Oscillospiraceae bacterium]|nr:DUF2752 domain-containing protein [Oscillospiraceae bacterium]